MRSLSCFKGILQKELNHFNLVILTMNKIRKQKQILAKWNCGSQVFLREANKEIGKFGFIVHPRVIRSVISWDIASSCITRLMTSICKKPKKIIVASVLASVAEGEKVKKFYRELVKTLQMKSTYSFILSDLNTKVRIGKIGKK